MIHTFSAPPSMPEGPLEACDITANSLTLNWKPPLTDGGQPLTGYLLESRDVRRPVWSPVATLPPDATSYTVKNLVTNNEYNFRIIAQNSEGKSAPLENIKPFKPTRAAEVPSVPRGSLQVTNLTDNSASLQWQAPEDSGGADLTHYLVDVSVDGGDWINLGKVDSYSTKFRCQDLKTDATHVFRVSAVNKVGVGKALESQPVIPSKPPGKAK